MAYIRSKQTAPPVLEIEKHKVQGTLFELDVKIEDFPRPIPIQSLHWFLGGVIERDGVYYNKEVMLKFEEKMRKLEEFRRSELYTKYHRLYDRSCGIYHKIQNRNACLENSRSHLLRLEEAASPMRRKKDKEVELRAAAARNAEETRKVAVTVRRELKRQSWCPYCGDYLGSIPHVDHIYPVSKGGRSVPKNSVFVCPQCNMNKTNLTLTMFIQKFSLDRDVIEERLKQLHKDF